MISMLQDCFHRDSFYSGMRYFCFIVIVFTFAGLKLNGQSRTFSLSLYYAINQTNSELNTKKLDSLCDRIGKGKLELKITGYADFLNNNRYNEQLSLKRAEYVKTYLLKKIDKAQITAITCVGLGEQNSKDNQSKEGEVSQRRVDVFITEQVERKKIGDKNNQIQQVEKKDQKIKPESVKTKNSKAPTTGLSGFKDLKEGESLTVEGLSFIPGRHVLMRESMPVLEELLNTLKEHSAVKIEIQGHICCMPSDEDGMDLDTQEMNLSENRAKAVYNYLVRNGIDASRLTFKGYGHTQPKVKLERTPEEEQMNRRVEIKVLEN